MLLSCCLILNFVFVFVLVIAMLLMLTCRQSSLTKVMTMKKFFSIAMRGKSHCVSDITSSWTLKQRKEETKTTTYYKAIIKR
jgi:hypothetical protein